MLHDKGKDKRMTPAQKANKQTVYAISSARRRHLMSADHDASYSLVTVQ